MKLPAERGIARYSMVFVPVTPDGVFLKLLTTLGSYSSKSDGKSTLGVFNNFMFPVPEMVTVSVTASLALTEFLLMSELMLKRPTAPV